MIEGLAMRASPMCPTCDATLSSPGGGSDDCLNYLRPPSALGQPLVVSATRLAGQIPCKRLVKSNENDWSSPCNYSSSGFGSH